MNGKKRLQNEAIECNVFFPPELRIKRGPPVSCLEDPGHGRPSAQEAEAEGQLSGGKADAEGTAAGGEGVDGPHRRTLGRPRRRRREVRPRAGDV